MSAASLDRINSALTSTSLGDYRIQPQNITAESIPDNLRKDCVLFYTPDTEPLARKIASEAGGSVELGSIRWKWVPGATQLVSPAATPGPHTSASRRLSMARNPGLFIIARRAPGRRCFPDGFPDLFVHDATRIRNRHVGFLASFHNPATIFEQARGVRACRTSSSSPPPNTLLHPFLPPPG